MFYDQILLSIPSWAVVLPREVRTPTRLLKLELAIYPELQVRILNTYVSSLLILATEIVMA
jgi:hypothetical protein